MGYKFNPFTGTLDDVGVGAAAVTGSGASPRVAFWDGASSLAGDAGLTYDSTNDTLSILGSADAKRLLLRGNSTQTSKIMEIQNSGGGVLATIDNAGKMTLQSELNPLNAGLTVTAAASQLYCFSLEKDTPNTTSFVSVADGSFVDTNNFCQLIIGISTLNLELGYATGAYLWTGSVGTGIARDLILMNYNNKDIVFVTNQLGRMKVKNTGELYFQARSSTTERTRGSISCYWEDNTDATRRSIMTLNAWDNNGELEGIRITAKTGSIAVVGIGSIDATARLHIQAGTATAGTAPLKFNSGTLLTAAEDGAVEFLTDKFYGTITTGAARKELTLNDVALTSGRVPFATTNGRLTDDADITFATDTLTVTKIVASTNIQVGGGAVVASLDHGTYTPTLTNVANLDASTAYECQYMRVGNTVTVSGKVDIDPTLPATSTQLGISLPIASNLGAVEDCAGTAFASGIANQGAAILGDATNNRAQLQYISGDTTNQAMYFTFTYQVI